jgi:ADP-heptose:LPS heptosyltransferase
MVGVRSRLAPNQSVLPFVRLPFMSGNPSSVDRYTARTRSSGRMDKRDDTKLERIKKTLEGAVRSALYGLLQIAFRNPSVSKKIRVSELRSVLVMPYGDAIGDMIVATPIWRAIKKRNPNCKIGVITSERNVGILTADPDVDETYHFEHRRDFYNLNELRRARKVNYQVVLNLHFTHLSDHGFIANYLSRRGIKITADHVRRAKYKLFFNHIGRRARNTTHLSIHSLELLSEVIDFEEPLTLQETWPSLSIPDDVHKRVNALLRTKGIASSSPYIVLHLQAGTSFRELGPKNSIAVAQLLAARYPEHTIFLTAAPNSYSVDVQALPREGRVQYFETSRDLLELASLIAGAALVITPETSITHFASAAHTPTLVLMSNRDHIPVEWLPLATPARILAPHVAGDSVATIPSEEVFEAACSILDGQWTTTQTSLDVGATPHPMFQSTEGNRSLEDFANSSHTL